MPRECDNDDYGDDDDDGVGEQEEENEESFCFRTIFKSYHVD